MTSRPDAAAAALPSFPPLLMERPETGSSTVQMSSGNSLTSYAGIEHGKIRDNASSARSNRTDSQASYLYMGDLEKTAIGKPQSSDASATLMIEDPVVPLPESPVMSSKQKVAFIFITCIAQFLSLSALCQTVAPVILLGRHFNIDNYGELSWFTAAFSMTVGTFILPAGEL